MAEDASHGLEETTQYMQRAYKVVSDLVMRDFQMLARYCPDMLARWMDFRRTVYPEEWTGALSFKDKELIATAIEVALRKTNPPPEGHVKRAVEAGATVQELAETLSICILLAGMVTYREAGRFVLQTAIEHAQHLGRPGT